jgi:aspartate-semialdehyde dehydrogenase
VQNARADRVPPHIDVGILGATGIVGQQFVKRLVDHPWFQLRWLSASERSEGRRYRDVTSWRSPSPLPPQVADMVVSSPITAAAPRVVFSALDAAVAGELEAEFARAGHIVISNARSHRMAADVPLLVPEINPSHVALVDVQRRARRWPGAIATNPNCSTAILDLALAPLRAFGLEHVLVTTMQALSGAGYPGVPALDIAGNIIPFIAGEESKIETETRKILGVLEVNAIADHPVVVSAQTTRVPVLNGHTVVVSARLSERPSIAAVRDAMTAYAADDIVASLPSSPARPLVVFDDDSRPQPVLDAGLGDGMTVSVGRLRACPVLGVKFIALGDNTVRGAAGAAILNAELLAAEGRLS